MTFSGNDELRYEKHDGKAYITLNRPEVLNAFNAPVRTGLLAALIDIRDDPAVRVGIVTGAGGRSFSVGMDLKRRAQLDQEVGANSGSEGGPPGGGHWTQLGLWKPMIAAIDGYCLAGGFEMALQCDIRIATQHSRFGLPEPRRGLLGGYGLANLSSMIPLGGAFYIHLTGGQIDADTAARWCVVQEVVPDRETLMRRANEIAGEIMECAPLSVEYLKRIVTQTRKLTEDAARNLAQPWHDMIYQSEDRLEGPRAFAEKRKPVWKGR